MTVLNKAMSILKKSVAQREGRILDENTCKKTERFGDAAN